MFNVHHISSGKYFENFEPLIIKKTPYNTMLKIFSAKCLLILCYHALVYPVKMRRTCAVPLIKIN